MKLYEANFNQICLDSLNYYEFQLPAGTNISENIYKYK